MDNCVQNSWIHLQFFGLATILKVVPAHELEVYERMLTRRFMYIHIHKWNNQILSPPKLLGTHFNHFLAGMVNIGYIVVIWPLEVRRLRQTNHWRSWTLTMMNKIRFGITNKIQRFYAKYSDMNKTLATSNRPRLNLLEESESPIVAMEQPYSKIMEKSDAVRK